MKRRQAWLAVIAAGMIGWVVVVVARYQERQWRPLFEFEQAAIERGFGQRHVLDPPVDLDAASAYTVSGPYRGLAMRVRARLSSRSVLEVRLRCPADADPIGRSARGVALFVSSDPAFAGGWVFENTGAFERLATLDSVPDGDVEIEIEVDGDRFVATVGGRRITAHKRLFPSGGVTALAARGQARLETLVIEPRPSDRAPSRAAPILRSVAAPVAVIAVIALMLRVMLGLGTMLAVALAASTVVPLAVSLSLTPDGGAARAPAIALFLQCALTLFVPLVGVGRLTFLRLVGFGAVGLSLVFWQHNVVLRHPDWPPNLTALNYLSYVEWSGAPVDDARLYLEHPVLRRWNFYLADHRFRGRRFTLTKPAGVRRVIALGGSSTYGLSMSDGDDYPTVTEGLLNDDDARAVEVLNAGYPAAVSSRLYRFLRDGLLAFDPDVVTLNLTYNDAVVLSGGDEEEYFDAVTEGGRSGLLDRLRERRRQDELRTRARSLFDAFARGEAPRWRSEWGAAPAERFESRLRDFAELAGDEGFALVLIKEPLSAPWIWKDAMYAAIDRVAADYDLRVVDPSARLTRAGGKALFLDTVHPTAEGYRVIAESLAPVLAEVLDAR